MQQVNAARPLRQRLDGCGDQLWWRSEETNPGQDQAIPDLGAGNVVGGQAVARHAFGIKPQNQRRQRIGHDRRGKVQLICIRKYLVGLPLPRRMMAGDGNTIILIVQTVLVVNQMEKERVIFRNGVLCCQIKRDGQCLFRPKGSASG